MIQYPNRVSQEGTYHTGTPNYVDYSGAASTGMVTFAAKATSESWSDGDTLGILVETGNTYWLGLGTWDSANEYIELTTQEEAVGTLSDSESVTISAVLTKSVVDQITAPPLTRELLSADRTYYVATDGSDSNDGLSSGSPFLTIQKAVDVVCSIDCSIYQATIQIADGTYTDPVILGAPVAAKAPIIQGNATTPTNVVLSTTDAECILLENRSVWTLKDFKLQNSGAAKDGLRIVGGAAYISGLVFGATVSAQINLSMFGMVKVVGAYSISGGATSHIYCFGASYSALGSDIMVSGTPAFTSAFVTVEEQGFVLFAAMSFIGSATGKRYAANFKGLVDTRGGGSTFLPGSTSGTIASDGLYT